MARYRRRSRGGYRSYGSERAIQHIREAEALSRELGGTDKDVKEYFFNLRPDQLAKILTLYGLKHGDEARSYAEQTIRKWQTGTVKMSGMVASRLFNLLPPIMPIEEKYRLTENLWKHVGPSSKRLLRVGINSSPDDVLDKVRDHIDGVVTGYQIPSSLANRFQWISAGDVTVKQQLLNHLQVLEKSLVVEGARQQLPVMLAHLKSEAGNNTHRLSQILQIGKHELEIRVDRDASGVTLEAWRPPASPKAASNGNWVWWLLGAAAVVAFFLFRK